MRCDLHVHSRYSGSADLPLIRHLSRECYSDPHDVYRVAKARGMDLVTITDHDTIEGALELADLPDFIVGEELTCEIAPGRQIHLGLWDLSERTHHGLTQRRCDPEALFAFLAENDIPACINHPFSPLTGAREADDLHRAFAAISAIETQNGMMPKVSNEYARSEARRRRLAQVGGSDAHTLDRIGHAFTTVPRADNREEFLAGLRDGFTVPAGGAGTYARLTADVIRIFSGAVVENTVQALLQCHSFGDVRQLFPRVLGWSRDPFRLSRFSAPGAPRAGATVVFGSCRGRRAMNAVLIYLDSNDRRLSDHLENWCPPRWIRFWMVWSTKLGDGWLWAFVAMTLIWRGEHATFVAAGLACCAANIAMIALKRRFRRCRPRAQAANQLFQPVRADLSGFDGFSFPSGHTMNAFAISVVLLAMHPRLLPVLAFAATSIGASRVVLRMHFVTDVVAGAILGAAIGSVVLRAM